MDGPKRGEAGGRLDLLGGLVAASGALSLSKGTRATTRVEISPRDGGGIMAFSCQSERERAPFSIEGTTMRALLALPPSSWAARWKGRGAADWMSTIWGAFGLFARELNWWPTTGLHFRVASDVPRGQGLASSSALCMATFRALEQAAGRQLGETILAHLSVRVEREVLGVAGDLSEALAYAWGAPDAIRPVLCRPDHIYEALPMPLGVMVAGCPLGAVRDADGSTAQTARVAAEMGRAFLETKLGTRHFLSEYAPSQLGDELPITLSGNEFRARFGEAASPSDMEAEHLYPVRAATRFEVEENFRAVIARALWTPTARHAASFVGELLLQSHVGLAGIGLSSPPADALVEAIRTRGVRGGFHGARMSGQGTGQTVVVLLERASLDELETLRADFPMAGALIL